MGTESQNISPETWVATTERIIADILTNKRDTVISNMNAKRVDALINTAGKDNGYTPGHVDYTMASFRTDSPNSTLRNIHAFEDIASDNTTDPAQEAGKNTEKPTDYKNGAKEHSEKNADGTYTIKAGDNLTKIAGKFDTTIQALAELNGIKHVDKIKAGATLKLPETTQTPASENKNTPATADTKSAQNLQKHPTKKEDHHKAETPNTEHKAIAKPTEAKQADTKPIDTKPIKEQNTPVDVADSPAEIQRVKEELSKLNPKVVQALWLTIKENTIICPNGEPIMLDGKTEKVAISRDRSPDGKVYITCTDKPEFGGGKQVLVISNGKADNLQYPRGISINGKLVSPLQQDILSAVDNPKKPVDTPMVSDLGPAKNTEKKAS